MGLLIRKSTAPQDKYGQIVYYFDDNGFVRRSTAPHDKYGEIVYYVDDNNFVRKSTAPHDKYGEIVYYIDEEGFVRKSTAPHDKYGAILYYVDGGGFVRKSTAPHDKYGQIVFFLEKDNKATSTQPSTDEKKGMVLLLAFVIGLILAPVLVVLGMFGKFFLGGLFKNVLEIKAFQKFRKIYSIVNISWLVLAIAAIVVLAVLQIDVTIPLYALVGVNVLLLVLSIVIGNKIYNEHKDELSAPIEVEGADEPRPNDLEADILPKAIDAEYGASEKAPSDLFDNLEAIKKLKELLDLGAITRAEFEAKKNELLRLPTKPVNKKNISLIWLWISLGFTVFSYMVNVIISLSIDGKLYSMFKYVLEGYIAGFICMGIGIIGYIISFCFLLKDKETKIPKIVSLILMVVLLCVTFAPLVLH